MLCACFCAHAADVFTPPSLEAVTSAEQNARIARLEEALKKTLDRLEKETPAAESKGDVKLDAPVTLPPPPAKSNSNSSRTADQLAASIPDEPRVLGVMNDYEIYVQAGVVRQRSVNTAAQTFPPLTVGGKK